MEQNFPNLKGKDEKAVFCSQLVAILYKALGVPSFMKADPVKYTPLELEVAPEFKGRCYFVKEHNEKLLKDGCFVPTIDRTTYLQTLIDKTVHHESWEKVASSGDSEYSYFIFRF
jgi:hypothetical protein